MLRKILIALLCGLLLPVFCISVSASDSPSAIANDEGAVVVDHADILQPNEEQTLASSASGLRDEYNMEIVILTIDSLDGQTARDYADDFYNSSYGKDGILFLLAMEEREWYISTYGEAIYALTDYGIQSAGQAAVWYFSEGYYSDGLHAYLTELNRCLSAYQAGDPVDGYADYSGDYGHGDRYTVVYYGLRLSAGNAFVIALAIGLTAAGITIWVMRSSMNTKRPQPSAEAYLKTGSYRLHTNRDIFLYSNIKKIRRQQNTNHGSRGGGSSIHRSSGGRRHGGGGGRF